MLSIMLCIILLFMYTTHYTVHSICQIIFLKINNALEILCKELAQFLLFLNSITGKHFISFDEYATVNFFFFTTKRVLN